MSQTMFFGQAGGNRVWRFPFGADDAGVPITMRVKTNALAPAGAGGECLFTTLYLAITATMATDVVVTPVVDGRELNGESGEPDCRTTVTLEAAATRTRRIVEIALTQPYVRGGIERGRVALRGTWVQAKLEAELAAGDLVVELVDVEHEIVRESRQAEGTA